MSFVPIDDLDVFFAEMRANEHQAMANLQPEQRTITWGSYAFMVSMGIRIFGYVWTEAEFEANERDCGADDEEMESSMESLRDSHERGYRFGRWYSMVEPDGEIGSNHVSNMVPITKEQFDQIVQTQGWRA